MISERIVQIVDLVAETVISHTDRLTELDQAIGDGDHGINMKRGLNAVLDLRDRLSDMSFSKALQKIGATLVMSIGGASGPLYGTLCMTIGKAAEEEILDMAGISRVVAEGVAAVKRRGKSDAGEKTMLDVLVPVAAALDTAVKQNADFAGCLSRLKTAADQGLEATRPMVATKGRASFLGPRSAGHLDPGAQSSQLIVRAVCRSIEQQVSALQDKTSPAGCVGIVIVSHSLDVARGTADMVRQMVGDDVPLAWCGGNPDRGLGTDVVAIRRAVEQVWNPAGVAILVDLGGAETNSEMAIEMLPASKRDKVVICNAPIVEGAVMAATEAAGGGSLEQVRATAEELGGI